MEDHCLTRSACFLTYSGNPCLWRVIAHSGLINQPYHINDQSRNCLHRLAYCLILWKILSESPSSQRTAACVIGKKANSTLHKHCQCASASILANGMTTSVVPKGLPSQQTREQDMWTPNKTPQNLLILLYLSFQNVSPIYVPLLFCTQKRLPLDLFDFFTPMTPSFCPQTIGQMDLKFA